MRHGRKLLSTGRRRLAVACVAAQLLVVAGVEEPVVATTLQATLLSPVDGTVSSNPQEPHHRPYDGDFAFDVHTSQQRRPVYARFRNPNGTLSLSVAGISRACASGNFSHGGDKIVLNVYLNGSKVGTVTYAHLTGFPIRSGNVPVGAHIGYAVTGADGVSSTSCWSGPHVHVEPRNDVRYACYFSRGLGTAANGDTALGIIGGEHATGPNRVCPSGAESATPSWSAAFVDQAAFLDAGLTQPWNLAAAYPSQEGWFRFRLRNTGSRTWSATGANPVRLGTDGPRDRASPFFISGQWLSVNRPTAVQPSSVAPGQTATFVFKVRVPAGSGAIREHYQLVADGAAWFGPGMWLDIARTAPPTTTTAPAPPPTTVPAPPSTTPPATAPAPPPAPTSVGPAVLGTGAVSPGGRVCFSVVGSPGDVALVNLTPVLASGSGNGQLIPSKVEPPGASNVNFGVGTVDPNLAAAQIGGDGKVCFVNSQHSRVHLVADHLGTISKSAYKPASASGAPARRLDTRNSDAVRPGGRVCFSVVGSPGDVALVNLTPVLASGPGNGQLIPSGVAPRAVSNVNFAAGSVDPNLAAVPVGADGKVCYVNSAHSSVHVVADHLATISRTAVTLATSTGAPARLVDTREGLGGGLLGPGGRVCFSVVGSPGDVALVNLTPVLASGPGDGQLIPSGVAPRAVSNVNFAAGSVDPNLTATQVGADGKVCFVNSDHSRVHVVADHLATISRSAYKAASESGAPARRVDTR